MAMPAWVGVCPAPSYSRWGQLLVGFGVDHQFSWMETQPNPEAGYLYPPAGCQQG